MFNSSYNELLRTRKRKRRELERVRERESLWRLVRRARAKALRARYEIIPAALPRESSLPSTAHALMSTWLSASRRVSRARNSALRVSQGRGYPAPQPPWGFLFMAMEDEKHNEVIATLVASDEKLYYEQTL